MPTASAPLITTEPNTTTTNTTNTNTTNTTNIETGAPTAMTATTYPAADSASIIRPTTATTPQIRDRHSDGTRAGGIVDRRREGAVTIPEQD